MPQTPTPRTRERKKQESTEPVVSTKPKAVEKPNVNRGAQATATKPTAVEQALKEATGVDFRIVNTDDLVFNDYNPNAMEVEMFDSLTEQVREEGGIPQTLIVRPHPTKPGKMLVVDGEHRGKSAKIAGIKQLLAAVVPYTDSKAKLKTLTMNGLRGQNIPIKLAHLLVDLQKTYSQEEIARATGIGMDKQVDVMKLLDVPDFSDMDDDTVQITVDSVERPIQVNLLLMPDEKKSWDEAMVKAMGIGGADITPLLGEEVQDYQKAMTDAMGLAGVKLRNIALTTICRAFIKMPEEFKRKVAEETAKALKDKNKKKSKKSKSDDPLE